MKSVYSAVRTGYLNKAVHISSLKGQRAVYAICVNAGKSKCVKINRNISNLGQYQIIYGQVFEGFQNFRYLGCRNVIREEIEQSIAARNRNSIVFFYYIRVSDTLTLTHNNTQSVKTNKLFYSIPN
jgi:hypothetical protein